MTVDKVDILAILDESAGSPDGRHEKHCSIGKFVKTLDSAVQTKLNSTMADKDYTTAALVRAFTRLGLDTNRQKVLRHRAWIQNDVQKCQCRLSGDFNA